MFRFESAIFICFKMIRYTDMVNEPHHEKTGCNAYAKKKTQISFVVTAKPISTFVFAT